MAEMELSELLPRLSEPKGIIASTEFTFRQKIDGIVKRILDGGYRVLMLAGPSGSGKTTSANMIADAIRAQGESATVISLDSFYRDNRDPRYPRLADGGRDMENPDALDVPLLSGELVKIARGMPFVVPNFDFSGGVRRGVSNYPAMKNSCVIVEGLHALNPKISGSLPAGKSLKLFVSVSTNLNENGERIVSGRRIRFIRRLVRDSLYRGASAELTLSLWKSVLDGENDYLYPYKGLADLYLDTFHPYEIAVEKPFAEALLSGRAAEHPYAQRILPILGYFDAVSETLVPETSLIREFIPGGVYESLY